METAVIENKLISEAKNGDQVRMNHLIEQVRPRLHDFVYRLTLDYHETQDIVQESLTDMAKCLGKLEDHDKFWPWLRRIALNKKNNFRRNENRIKQSEKMHPAAQAEPARGLSELISKELSETIFKLMSELKPQHRKVLVLRCYEEMEYSEIAEEMNRSEFGTRMLFRRAINTLKKKLSRNGLKGVGLLTALIVFGKMTSTAQAATGGAAVTAASLKAGTAAGVVTALTSTSGIVTTTLVGIAAISSPFILSDNKAGLDTQALPVHSSQASVMNFVPQPQTITESLYSFPSGPEGPLYSRFTESDPESGRTVGQWLQNENGNYYYDHKSQVVYILNQRFVNKDLSIMRLPTDSMQHIEALNRIEGEHQDAGQFIKLEGAGLLFVKGIGAIGRTHTESGRHPNISNEEYFQNPWPKDASIADQRDEIHRRGWAYFTVSGQLNGKSITGHGQNPFVTAALKQCSPRIWLMIDGTAYQGENEYYPKGFARPWEGLHTIDTVRRDAALVQKPFTMTLNEKKTKSAITVTDHDIKIIYTVDMEKDWIENIRFAGRVEGQINFAYMQKADNSFNVQAGEHASSEHIDSLMQLTEWIGDEKL